jgi:hypothetical protein
VFGANICVLVCMFNLYLERPFSTSACDFIYDNSIKELANKQLRQFHLFTLRTGRVLPLNEAIRNKNLL